MSLDIQRQDSSKTERLRRLSCDIESDGTYGPHQTRITVSIMSSSNTNYPEWTTPRLSITYGSLSEAEWQRVNEAVKVLWAAWHAAYEGVRE